MAIDRNYILEKMKGRMMSAEEFDFERLQAPPLYSLLSYQDIEQLRKLATSIKYAGRPIERMQMIDKILVNRGFRKFTGGTNRAIYKFLENDQILIKVATDAVGIGDSPREFMNQQYYKPFVPKVFEVSPCGTVGLFERVVPITSREEFLSVAPYIYDIILNWFVGEYVCDDIGTEYFMNWGIRKGFGAVLLDFPYSYKLDGNKLFCNKPDETQPGGICGGVIDYDDGFNHLRCSKCGAEYKALELKKAIETNTIIQKGGRTKMKVGYGYDDGTIVEAATEKYIDTAPKLVPNKKGKPVKTGKLTAVAYSSGKRVVNATKEDDKNKPKIVAKAVEGEDNVKDKSNPDTNTQNKNKSKMVAKAVNDNNGSNPEPKDSNDDKNNTTDQLKYVMFGADITNTAEIDGDEEHKTKVLILKDITSGNLVRFDINNNGNPLPLVIPTINDMLLSEISIVKKEAQIALQCKIDNLEEENESLKKSNEELNSELEMLKAEYDKLLGEGNNDNHSNEDEDNGLPYYVDSKGRKRDKATNQFCTASGKKKDEKKRVFDTSSPLIPEDESEIPVGAQPPKNNNDSGKPGTKRSARYDPEFYNRGNTSGK